MEAVDHFEDDTQWTNPEIFSSSYSKSPDSELDRKNEEGFLGTGK